MATDLSQDQGFQNASSDDQHAYLMATDPGYAKAAPEDQKAYREHVTTITNPDAMLSRTQEPTPNPIAKAPKSLEEYAEKGPNELTGANETPEQGAQDAGATAAVGGTALPFAEGLLPGMYALGRTVAGGWLGSKALAPVGRDAGKLVGEPEAGETAGRWTGGLLGSGLAAKFPEAGEGILTKVGVPESVMSKFRPTPQPPEPNSIPISKSPYWNRMKSFYRSATESAPAPTPTIDYAKNRQLNTRMLTRSSRPYDEHAESGGASFTKPPGYGGGLTGAQIGEQEAQDAAAKGMFPGKSLYTPDSPPPNTPTTYQSYTREQLMDMAKKGDVRAIRELDRSPANQSLEGRNFNYMREIGKRTPFREYNTRGKIVKP